MHIKLHICLFKSIFGSLYMKYSYNSFILEAYKIIKCLRKNKSKKYTFVFSFSSQLPKNGSFTLFSLSFFLRICFVEDGPPRLLRFPFPFLVSLPSEAWGARSPQADRLCLGHCPSVPVNTKPVVEGI